MDPRTLRLLEAQFATIRVLLFVLTIRQPLALGRGVKQTLNERVPYSFGQCILLVILATTQQGFALVCSKLQTCL